MMYLKEPGVIISILWTAYLFMLDIHGNSFLSFLTLSYIYRLVSEPPYI